MKASPLIVGLAAILSAPHQSGAKEPLELTAAMTMLFEGAGIILLAISNIAVAVRVRLLEHEVKHLRSKIK